MKRATTLTALLTLSVLLPEANSATFTSVASTPWTNPATWNISGVDTDGLPDSDDDVTISTGNSVSLTSTGSCRSLTVSGGASFTWNSSLLIYGSLSQNGSMSGGATSSLLFQATGTFSGGAIAANSVYFYQNYTIASGASIAYSQGIIVSASRTLNNNGTARCIGTLALYAGAIWNNNANATLRCAGVSANGTLNASGTNNNVIFENTYSTVKCPSATYYNLELRTSGTKALNGTLNVLGNLLINTGVTLNCANNNINIGGNWTNTANTTCTNMATVTFNGTGTQTITRSTTEIFNNLTMAGSGNLVLARAIRCNGNLTINTGNFDVSASNFAVEVRGNWTNNAGFNARQGTVTFGGSGVSAQVVSGTNSNFYNVTSTNTGGGVSVTSNQTITNLLTVTSGAFGPSGAFITLPATGATTYARIGTVGGTLTGTGWIYQTYINGPATAYWQYCSTPINGNTLNDWDSDTRFYMSGVGGNDGTACCPTFYSVRRYNEPTNTFTNITSVSHALVQGRGYMIWMADNLNSLTAPLVYDSRGLPGFGNVSYAITAGGAGGGYNLVGNPYACPINYSSVVTASGNLGASFLVLDQSTSNYVTNPNGGVIGPGQGFLAPATSSGNIVFNEGCKNTTALPNIIRLGDPENYVRIKVKNIANGKGGETAVHFRADASAARDAALDLPFLPSPNEDAVNIWSTGSDATDYLLNTLPASEDEIVIPVTVEPTSLGQHEFLFQNINGVTEYDCAMFEDPATGQTIDVARQSLYSFMVNSLGKRTFLLHFKRTQGGCRLANQVIAADLNGQSNVYANANGIFAQFGFESATDVTISMYNTLGQEVIGAKQYNVSNETVSLDLPGAHGIYFVRIQGAGQEITRKIYY